MKAVVGVWPRVKAVVRVWVHGAGQWWEGGVSDGGGSMVGGMVSRFKTNRDLPLTGTRGGWKRS